MIIIIEYIYVEWKDEDEDDNNMHIMEYEWTSRESSVQLMRMFAGGENGIRGRSLHTFPCWTCPGKIGNLFSPLKPPASLEHFVVKSSMMVCTMVLE